MAVESQANVLDLLVIGGGVNGAGIARDAAGRGLSVLLCEKSDLAYGTSSRSGKLVHGGLRYLEFYEFRLVREALVEREVLLELAPHIIWPLRFVLPTSMGSRPKWLIRMGLFLYDHLGGRKLLPGTRTLNLRKEQAGQALKENYRLAFEYSDCWVDDSRLVILNAMSAAEKGAQIRTRCEFVSARRDGRDWQVELRDTISNSRRNVVVRAIVNASGPWVEISNDQIQAVPSSTRVRLVKGSHIVVPKFWEGGHAYLFQHSDKRVIFVNPYENDYALIGTTDVPFDGDPKDAEVDPAEIEYLCSAVNQYFRQQLSPDDVVNSFTGVRPLLDDMSENPSAVTRDYYIEVLGSGQSATVVTVFGGKITTYRKLAEDVMKRLRGVFPEMGAAWTDKKPLPGGEPGYLGFDEYCSAFQASHDWMPRELSNHYLRLYGTRAKSIVGDAKRVSELGQHFGGFLYECEVAYLIANEWAMDADDVVSRRTKEGLRMTASQVAHLDRWMARYMKQPASMAGDAQEVTS